MPGWRGQPALDLIVTLDDATSEILSLFLVAEKGTASTFRGLREVVAEHGLFCADPGRPSFRPEPPPTKKLTVDELQKHDNFTR
jgi:hypothetical protein